MKKKKQKITKVYALAPQNLPPSFSWLHTIWLGYLTVEVFKIPYGLDVWMIVSAALALVWGVNLQKFAFIDVFAPLGKKDDD